MWKVPVDDGGAPILHYVIEKMDVSRGTWSNVGMTTSLYHDIIRLIHKREYLFRVKAVNSIGESDVLETDKSIIAQNEFGTTRLVVKILYLEKQKKITSIIFCFISTRR